MQPPAAARNRYRRRTAVLGAIYVVSIFGADYLIGGVGVPRPLAFLLALVPGFAAMALFFNGLAVIRGTQDEFMRMLAVRQQLIASGFAISVACAWGFLEMYKLVPHVSAIFILVAWACGLLVGQIANRISHGVWGTCL